MFDDHDPIYGEVSDLDLSQAEITWILDELLRADNHPRWIQGALQYLLSFPKVDSVWPPLLPLLKVMVAGAKANLSLERLLYKLTFDIIYAGGVAHPEHRLLWPGQRYHTGFHTKDLFKVEWWVPPKSQKSFAGVTQRLKHTLWKGDFYAYRHRVWLPWETEPPIVEANKYAKECRRLQASKAGRKAKRLLMDHLTDAQRSDYYKRGTFVICSSLTDKWRTLYLIDNSFPNGNIFEIEKGKVVANWCFHPEDPYPLDDILLTQKLLIETDHEEFQAKANRHKREEYNLGLNGYEISMANAIDPQE